MRMQPSRSGTWICAGRLNNKLVSTDRSGTTAQPRGAMRRVLAAKLSSLLAPLARPQVPVFGPCGAEFASSRTRMGRPGSRVAAGPDGGRPRADHDPANPASADVSGQDSARLLQLESALALHNDLYYNQQRPVISDAAYDDLKKQYRQLAARIRREAPEEVALPVGAPLPLGSPLRKVAHRVPMLSLAAVNSREEAAAWLEKTLARLPQVATATATAGTVSSGEVAEAAEAEDGTDAGPRSVRGSRGKGRKARAGSKPDAAPADAPASHRSCVGWVVEPKVDGLAVRVLYTRTSDGRYCLQEAATRGDGTLGEDVTHNALYGGIAGLPYWLLHGPSWSWGRREGLPGWEAAGSVAAGDTSAAATAASGAAAGRDAPAATASVAAPAPPGPPWVDVRGEVFVRTADLELVNQELVASGLVPLANTRNAASGALRLMDPAECRRRRLSFVAYAALAPPPPQLPSARPPTPHTHPPFAPTATATSSSAASSTPASVAGAPSSSSSSSGAGAGVTDLPPEASSAGPLLPSHWDTLQWLQAAGFNVSPDNRLCGGAEEALRSAEKWMAGREALGYDADGAVIKLDDTTLYDTLGTSSSDPRWAVAWKFLASEAVTRLEGVELAVGRRGQITPVALLEPVVLGGVTVRRASLHNVGLATGLGLHVGDSVVVRRSGDVIPQVVRVLPELRPPGAVPWRPPSDCPSCGGPVRRVAALTSGSGDQLLCDNPTCGAKSGRRLLHFAAVCLKGSNVSKGVVAQLQAAGLLRDLYDFYGLDQGALAALPGFGARRSTAVLAAVAASRSMSSAVLLEGLNIRLVGQTAAAALGAAFPSLDALAAATREAIAQAAGVGPAVASSVYDWFQQPTNQELIRRLGAAGINCVNSAETPQLQQQQQPSVGAVAAGQKPKRRAGAARVRSPDVAGEAASDSDGQPMRESRSDGAQQSGAAAAPGAADRPTGLRLVGVAGLHVCVTGLLQGPHGRGMARKEIKGLLEAAGAEYHSAINSNTQVLLMGRNVGRSKMLRATARRVEVMREEQFWKRFGG